MGYVLTRPAAIWAKPAWNTAGNTEFAHALTAIAMPAFATLVFRSHLVVAITGRSAVRQVQLLLGPRTIRQLWNRYADRCFSKDKFNIANTQGLAGAEFCFVDRCSVDMGAIPGLQVPHEHGFFCQPKLAVLPRYGRVREQDIILPLPAHMIAAGTEVNLGYRNTGCCYFQTSHNR
jgi:hypothetical protein